MHLHRFKNEATGRFSWTLFWTKVSHHQTCKTLWKLPYYQFIAYLVSLGVQGCHVTQERRVVERQNITGTKTCLEMSSYGEELWMIIKLVPLYRVNFLDGAIRAVTITAVAAENAVISDFEFFIFLLYFSILVPFCKI